MSFAQSGSKSFATQSSSKSFAKGIAEKLGADWHSDSPLIIPEVWDVASARVISTANFKVLATSASSYAWANGFRPTERVNLEELLIVAARIIRDTGSPLIADLEGCYDRPNELIQKGVKAALHVGAKGIIISDGGRGGMHQLLADKEVANRIKSARLAAIEMGLPITLIAKTDTFHLGNIISNPFNEAIRRAKTYLDAGADLIQIGGLQHIDVTGELTEKIAGPVGISVTRSNAASISDYKDVNVAVISLGTSLMRTALTATRETLGAIEADGNFDHLSNIMSENELAELLYSEPNEDPKISVAS